MFNELTEKLLSDCNCKNKMVDCQLDVTKGGCKPTASPKCKTSFRQVATKGTKLIKAKAPKCAAEFIPQWEKLLASCSKPKSGNAGI